MIYDNIWYDTTWYDICDMTWYDIWYMTWHDMIWYVICMIWYDTIYLLTAIGLSPGGSSTVHIYTQKIHRTIQNKQYTEQHNETEYTEQNKHNSKNT